MKARVHLLKQFVLQDQKIIECFAEQSKAEALVAKWKLMRKEACSGRYNIP